MKRPKGTLYACLGLQLVHHRRAIAAGEAPMGVYAFLVMYSRLEELDGMVPTDVAERCWTGDRKANKKRLDVLVRVGLLVRHDAKFEILGFEEFNEMRSTIDERRGSDRARKREEREQKRGCHAGHPPDKSVTPTPCPANVPVSDSDSVSVSDSLPESEEGTESLAGKLLLDDVRPIVAVVARMLAEAPPEPPSSAVVLGAGTFDTGADSFGEGVASVTGAPPPIAWWERKNLERVARTCPAGQSSTAWMFADGAEYARMRVAEGKRVTTRDYCEWVASQRQRPLARGRPQQAYDRDDFEIPKEMP